MVTFQELFDAMRAEGIEVAVELDAGRHRLVVRDPAGGRELGLPVERGFDRAATVLVLSARLRQALGPYGRAPVTRPGGAVARGSWPELERVPLRRPGP